MSDERLLTDDEKSHFRKWEMLFESDGWALLAKELENEANTAPTELFWSVTSWEDMISARARVRAALQLLNYPTLIELRKENLLAERQMALEDAIEDSWSTT